MSAPKKAEPPRTGRWLVPGICLALAALTFGVFGEVLTHDFVSYDDSMYVYGNRVVARGLTAQGTAWAFTTFYADNWHPLTWLSHMLDCQLFGLNPAGHHLGSLLIHILSVIVLFLAWRRMTGALWSSAFVAAMFAIHPLRLESVAWVAERKDVLSGLFFVLTIAAYARYAGRPSGARYALVALLFALGLMCKPMLVTAPLILLVLDFWPLRRTESARKLLMEKIPLLALSAASCVVTLCAQRGAIHAGGAFSLPYRLGNAAVSCLVYLWQMVWPVGLAVYYPYPRQGWPWWEAGGAMVVLAGVTVAAVRLRRTQPWLLAGWCWYLIMLLPVLGIVQVGAQAHGDRYTYLPQIGIGVALTWLAARSGISRAAAGGLMAVVLFMFAACAWVQAGAWQNTESLWTTALANTTENDVADVGMGLALSQKGMIDKAAEYFRRALEINPDSAPAHNNLGNALLQMGRVDDAIAQCREAVRLQPDDAEAYGNLGNALFRKGEADEAMADFKKAVELNPSSAMAHNSLGAVLLQKGKFDEAMAELQTALRLNPLLAEAHYNFALALLRQEKPDAAIPHFEQAVQIDPGNAKFQNDLAWLLATSGQALARNGRKALELATRANELTGGKDPVMLGTLAAADAECGQFDAASRAASDGITLAKAAGRADLVRQLNEQLQVYQTGHPYRQP